MIKLIGLVIKDVEHNMIQTIYKKSKSEYFQIFMEAIDVKKGT
jgi:hypothetical protein